MIVDNKFLYASKDAQLVRSNRFVVIAYVLFYLFVTTVVFVAFLRGFRTLGFTAMVLSINYASSKCNMHRFALT